MPAPTTGTSASSAARVCSSSRPNCRPIAEISIESSLGEHQPSELVCSKRIAIPQVGCLKALLEPANALLRAAMGKGVGHDIAGAALLQAVVADCRGSVQTLLDIALLQDLLRGIRFLRPDAGEAVGLKLHADRQLVGLGFGRTHSRLRYLLGDAEQVLNMMANLVGDDIGLGKIAGRAEARFHVLIKTQIDIDLLIERTIEGAHGRLRHAAGRLNIAREQNQIRLLVLPTHLPEDLVPDPLSRAEHPCNEVLPGIGVNPLRTDPTTSVTRIGNIGVAARNVVFCAGLIARNLNPATGEDLGKVDAEQQLGSKIDQNEQQDGGQAEAAPSAHRNDDPPATAREAEAASAEATAALILDSVAGIFLVEPHSQSPPCKSLYGGKPRHQCFHQPSGDLVLVQARPRLDFVAGDKMDRNPVADQILRRGARILDEDEIASRFAELCAAVLDDILPLGQTADDHRRALVAAGCESLGNVRGLDERELQR